jgi:hypothetical protein
MAYSISGVASYSIEFFVERLHRRQGHRPSYLFENAFHAYYAFGVFRRHAICRGRGQLPINVGTGRLVAGRIGQAGSRRRAERSPVSVFPDTRRLIIDDQGAITVYDTGSHRIFGVAQARSSDQTLSFTSQDGLVRIADLRKVARLTGAAATTPLAGVRKSDPEGESHA